MDSRSVLLGLKEFIIYTSRVADSSICILMSIRYIPRWRITLAFLLLGKDFRDEIESLKEKLKRTKITGD